MRSDFRTLLTAAVFLGVAQTAAIAQTLPPPWTAVDIGSPPLAGSTTLSGTTYTVKGNGSDIWYTSDQFHFMHQPMSGDGEVIARIISLTNNDSWTKAGVMIRESLSPQSRHATLVGTPGAGFAFQRRPDTAAYSTSGSAGTGVAPRWLRLVRLGDRFDAFLSNDGIAWTAVGSDTLTMGATVYVGLAVTSHNPSAVATATFDNVRVTSSSTGNQPPAVSIMQPASGSQYDAPANVTIMASASDPESRMASVGFYVNNNLVATDASAPYSTSWSSATPGTYTVAAMAQDADGGSSWSSPVTVVVRSPNGAPTATLTSPATGSTFTAPAAIALSANASDPEGQIARVAFFSGATELGADTTAPYSFSWSNVAAGTYSLTAVAYDAAGASGTSAAVTITVSPAAPPPPTFQSADIGNPATAGSTSSSNGVYTVRGAGSDIWNSSDQFRYVYQAVSGDVDVVAQVTSLTNTDSWAKAGVMIRETLAANSSHASSVMTAAYGASFQRRMSTGGASTHTTPNSGALPGWVRMVRTGNVFQAYLSSDGTTWTAIGSETIAMSASVYVGLAVTSHNTGTATTAVFDRITITTGGGNQPPTVTLTAPANGATFTAPATINLTASASDPEGQLARVEFFSGSTLLGTDTAAPYAFAWSNVAAGTYSIRAVAYDGAGANASSASVAVTVSAPSSTAPTTAVFAASTDHSTNVTSYLLSVFAQGADPATATPVATSDLGKPTPAANNDITVDRASFFAGLPSGNYLATVTAIGPGGQTRSASTSFVR